MGIFRDTVAAWSLSADWAARRRRRFRVGLVLFAIGLRQLAVRVSGMRR